MNIGIISPGAMGASVGAAAKSNGHRVLWAGQGRSDASHERAKQAGCEDCGTFQALVNQSDIILSICPPHDAEAVALDMANLGFEGTFVDCNAISPAKTLRLSKQHDRFVDGGIIGGPAWRLSDGTRLYLSGEHAEAIADLFTGSALAAMVVSSNIGEASALKMAFAAYTKGTTALLTAILSMADQHGVREALENQWGETFSAETHHRVVGNTAKAWRFAGEMREIAATFADAGLPDGFHNAAADVFESLSDYKNQPADSIEHLLSTMRAKRV